MHINIYVYTVLSSLPVFSVKIPKAQNYLDNFSLFNPLTFKERSFSAVDEEVVWLCKGCWLCLDRKHCQTFKVLHGTDKVFLFPANIQFRVISAVARSFRSSVLGFEMQFFPRLLRCPFKDCRNKHSRYKWVFCVQCFNMHNCG